MKMAKIKKEKRRYYKSSLYDRALYICEIFKEKEIQPYEMR